MKLILSFLPDYKSEYRNETKIDILSACDQLIDSELNTPNYPLLPEFLDCKISPPTSMSNITSDCLEMCMAAEPFDIIDPIEVLENDVERQAVEHQLVDVVNLQQDASPTDPIEDIENDVECQVAEQQPVDVLCLPHHASNSLEVLENDVDDEQQLADVVNLPNDVSLNDSCHPAEEVVDQADDKHEEVVDQAESKHEEVVDLADDKHEDDQLIEDESEDCSCTTTGSRSPTPVQFEITPKGVKVISDRESFL